MKNEKSLYEFIEYLMAENLDLRKKLEECLKKDQRKGNQTRCK